MGPLPLADVTCSSVGREDVLVVARPVLDNRFHASDLRERLAAEHDLRVSMELACSCIISQVFFSEPQRDSLR